LFCVGPGATFCAGLVDKATHSAYCTNHPDSVKGVVVVSVYQPSRVPLAQGTSSAVAAATTYRYSTVFVSILCEVGCAD